jgi:hypothetical protein
MLSTLCMRLACTARVRGEQRFPTWRKARLDDPDYWEAIYAKKRARIEQSMKEYGDATCGLRMDYVGGRDWLEGQRSMLERERRGHARSETFILRSRGRSGGFYTLVDHWDVTRLQFFLSGRNRKTLEAALVEGLKSPGFWRDQPTGFWRACNRVLRHDGH